MASWRQCIVAGWLLAVCACAQAAVHVRVDSLELSAGIRLGGVDMRVAAGPDGVPQMQLHADKVAVPALGWREVALDLKGQPQRARGGAWKFIGHVATLHAPGGALADADITVLFDPDGGTLEVDVQQGKGGLHALMPLDQTSHVQMTLAGLPLAWLRGVLASAWPDGRVTSGTVAGDVALDLADGGARISGRIRIAGAGLDSKGGNIAMRDVGAEGTFRIEGGSLAANVMFDGQLQGGQMLFGPLYAQLPAHAANVHLSAVASAAGIAIPSLDYDDHDALRVEGSLAFDAKGNLEKLDFKRFAATFPAAYTRYGTTFVQSVTGFQQLDTTGSLAGSLDLGTNGLAALDLAVQDVSVDSHGAGLTVAGLNGKVDWRARASRPATSLSWNQLSIYRIPFGPATLDLEDAAGALTLRQPVAIDVLGGSFQLNRFVWQPGAAKSRQLSAAFAVTDVDLPKLCDAFGWPEFGGKLGGAVPDFSYRSGDLVFDGGLSLNVFDGSVSVTDLGLQHLFGAEPQMSADIQMRELDLAQVTGVFDFGQITGRLNGDIQGLRLLDWKPVAFDAKLATDGGGKISQHAIKSLTQVGGGGIAGGLQSMALRLFKTFGYSRIGLSCVLADGVCAMGGITPDPDADGNGYTIVEGSGLPHITVIGHQRKVDWATLVNRLEEATKGGGPVVR
ncbi:MAG TPA: hypothetical protein VJ862_00100 [Rhodanobacteraceae bacterium]|nr:hypothetical protein [Rhodanobacteraceae bacterium]